MAILMTGIGSYLPEKIITNEELARRVDTDDSWIRRRTGIRQRHQVAEGEKTADMATAAARAALNYAGVTAQDIDMLVLATTTPDDTFPATAVSVQANLKMGDAIAFDVQAVCSGFVYALSIAEAMMQAGQARRALVIGAESFTKLLDWQERTTCVLFGDGAGAAVLERDDTAPDGAGILASVLHADGRLRDILHTNGGTAATGTSGTIQMAGQEVFRHAVEKLSAVMDEVLEKAGIAESEIDWLVPHQANIRIIDGMQRKLGLPADRVVRTVDQHANTSAASIPLALDQAVRDGRIQPGQLLALEAIGGGLAWGACLLRWGRLGRASNA